MKSAIKSKISKISLNQSLRRIVRVEIILIVLSYLVLFLVINLILSRQQLVTEKIFSRFQMSTDVQTLESHILQHINLERGYRLNPSEDHQELVSNNQEFEKLLHDTQKKLTTLSSSEAFQLNKEKVYAGYLDVNQQEITSILNILLGKEVLKHQNITGAQPDTKSLQTMSPADLEKRLNFLEQTSINYTQRWRGIIKDDSVRLEKQFNTFQRLRTMALGVQALLVILLVVLISYAYVLPSFEKILAQLVLQNDELTRQDMLKTEFLSISSHQLRTPLTAIKWALVILTKPGARDNEAQYKVLLNQTLDNSNAMIEVVNTLLNVSRLEQGRVSYKQETVNIIPIIEKVLTVVAPLAKEKQVTLETQFEAETAYIRIDPVYFKQIVQNLVDNSINYNRENGTVTVGVHNKNGDWQLIVADTGHGIDKKDQANIFTKFYRGSRARAVRPNGSGLGLYFIKKIIEQQDGKITMHSEVDKGTIFTVSFSEASFTTTSTTETPTTQPVAPTHPEPHEQAESAPPATEPPPLPSKAPPAI